MAQKKFVNIIWIAFVVFIVFWGYFLLVKKFKPTDREPLAPLFSWAWANPEKVEIVGYDSDSIEPSISKDGQYLFFNNGYQKPKETSIFYAKKITDNKFQFLGQIEGIKQGNHFSMTPDIDINNNFYFSSNRADGKTPKIYRGIFEEGKMFQVAMVSGIINQKRSWDPATFDGNIIYYTENTSFFDDFDIRVSTGDNSVLRNINTDKMEYAPSLSEDQLELFFTKADVKSVLGILSGKKAKIYIAKRNSVSEPFGQPEIIEAIARQDDNTFVEAPTITVDGKTLYYHKKDGKKFAIYKVTR